MAADLSAKKSNYVSKTVQATTQILDAYYMLRQLQDSNTDQSFVDGGKNSLTDEDFVGENNHLDLDIFMTGLKTGMFPIIEKIEENDFAIRAALHQLSRTR